MSDSPSPRSRSVGQWLVAVFFGLLAVAFFLRFLQYGYKWLAHVVDGDANFKAMTAWTLIYVIVCGAIAAVAYRLPCENEAGANQNGERET
jgi:hypothetical protein